MKVIYQSTLAPLFVMIRKYLEDYAPRVYSFEKLSQVEVNLTLSQSDE